MIGKTKKSSNFFSSPVIIILLILLILLILVMVATAYIVYRLHKSHDHLISISFFALFAGLIFECRRLANKWSDIFPIMFWSFVISFFAFLPGKKEYVYIFENHIRTWPYVFLLVFIFGYIIYFKEKVTFKLSEGFTLLQTIAVIYWFVDCDLVDMENKLWLPVMVSGLFCSLYAAFHVFTYTHLTHTHRLLLSLWSSIVMLLFAGENIYITFTLDQIENANKISHAIYVAFQYFLLGICSIYMVQNFFMLLQFLPGKHRFFNDAYFKDLAELKEEHIGRYSDQQVYILHSALVVVLAGADFYINYYYQLLPRHMAIWAVFFVYPVVLHWVSSPKHISVS